MAWQSNTNPNNRTYLDVSGNFSGTSDEKFQVKVAGTNGNETWSWRYYSDDVTPVTGVSSTHSQNKFTKNGHGLETGVSLRMYGMTFTNASNPGLQGIQAGTTYYVIRLDANSFKLAVSAAKAYDETAVSLGGQDETDLYYKVGWSSWFNADGDEDEDGDAITVDNSYTLRNGISIKFTRASKTSYTAGDQWTFQAFADYTLNATGLGEFKYLQSIDINDDKNLIAIDGAGSVAVIEGIDSDEPSILNTQLTIGAIEDNTELDFENKNKELYIAKGKVQPPRWLGYNKTEGMDGNSVDLQLKSELAMEKLVSSIETPDRNAFYKSTVLRAGGGVHTKNARIIVGIQNEGESKMYLYNRELDKQFTYELESEPTHVRKYIMIKDSSGYCDGFYIVRKYVGSNPQGIASVDIFDLDTSGSTQVGQTPQRKNTVHIINPVQNSTPQLSGLSGIHDIVIAPHKAPGHGSYSGSTGVSVIISGSKENFKDWSDYHNKKYEWIWKVDGTVDDLMIADVELGGGTWDDITPISNLSGYDNNPEDMQFMHPYNASDMKTQASRPPGWYWLWINSDNSVLDDTDVQSYWSDTAWTNDNTPVMDKTMDKWTLITNEHGIPPRTSHGIDSVPTLHSLEFCGYDSSGENPTVAFTCEYTPPQWFNSGNGICGGSVGQETAWSKCTDYENARHTGYWGADVYGPLYLDGDDGRQQESSNEAVVRKIQKQEARPHRWITHMIPFAGVEGPSQFKMLYHTVDYQDSRGIAEALKANSKGLIPDNADISDLLTNNKGIGNLNLDAVPSAQPLFGLNGRFNVYTEGALRRRQALAYVRPDNRKYCFFRFSDESATPMSLLTTVDAHPTVDLFPNDWNNFTSSYDYNAYTRWEKGLGQTAYVTDYKQGNTYYYNTTTSANNATNAQKHQIIEQQGSTGDDKNAYRLCESNWQVNANDWKDNTTDVWYHNEDISDFLYTVKHDTYQDIGLFRPIANKSGESTNLFTTGENYFNITTPTQVTGTKWAGETGQNTAFYRASLILDGYQETAFLSTTAAGPAGEDNDDDDDEDTASGKDIGTHLKVTVQIKGGFTLPKRVTGVAVYRATSIDDASTDPQTLYRFIDEIQLKSFGWNGTTGYWEFDVVDTGDAEATYEAINGISENMYSLDIKYSLNAQVNGYMFVGNCEHNEIEDASNYIFRSQAGKYSIFDWSKDFIQLPFVPTSMHGFQGKLYAFSASQMAMINPESMFIEDVVEGIGCIGPRAQMVTDGGFVWADYRNIYISTPQVVNIGDNILNIEDYGWLNITNEEKNDVRFGYDARRKAILVFFTRTISGSSYHRCWAFSLNKRRWDLWETDRKVIDTLLTKDGHTILLLDNNKICKYLANTSERADWEWHSKKLGMGDTMVDKKVRNIKVEGTSRNNTEIKYKVPDNDSSWQSGVDISTKFSGSQNSAIKLASADNGKLHWIKLRLKGTNGSTGDVRAKAASVIFKPKRPK